MAKMERIFRRKFTLAIGAAETTKEESFILEGEIGALFVRMPNWTNVVTGVVSILDQDGYEVVASSALARGLDHKVAADWPLPGAQTLKVLLSGVPGGAGGSVIVVAYGRQLG
jgi:hypothetical protein